MKKITMSKHKVWKIDPMDCRQVDLSRIFHITAQAITKWDCPRKENGNYVLGDVFDWRFGQQEKTTSPKADLEKEKLSLQCEKLRMEIEELHKSTISLEDAREKLRKHIDEVRTFFIDYGSMNLHLIVGRTLEEVHKYWLEIVQGAFNGVAEALK
jgi:hypothetical protein